MDVLYPQADNSATPPTQLHSDYLKWRPLETVSDCWAVWRLTVDADGFQRMEFDADGLSESQSAQIADFLNRKEAAE